MKNAQVSLDMIMLVVFLFIFALGAIIGYRTLTDLNDEIQSATDMSNESKDFSQRVTDHYDTTFDNAFILFLVLFWIILLVSSFLIDTHPAFFIVTLILLAFTLIIGMSLSNAYEEVISDDDLSASGSAFPMTYWVMQHILIVLIVIGLTTGVALYAKNQM